MNHYIIDGNNLIGKIKSLQEIQRKDKQSSRVGLVNILNRFFAGKKLKLTLHLDGYPNLLLHLSKGRITYSEHQAADIKIREEIERSKSPKLIVLVSSDQSLMNCARVNSATVIKSEEFYNEIVKSQEKNEEADRIRELEKENKTFMDLFGN